MPRRAKGPDGVIHTFPDDATDAEISEALSSVQKASVTDAMSKADRITGPQSMTDALLGLLPYIGGMTGGLIGGAGGAAFGLGFGGVPGAVGGATLGGATGEAMRQHGRRILGGNRTVPQSPTEAMKDIALEGGVQGAIEGAGQVISPVLAGGARSLYRGYLKPSLAQRSIKDARTIVQTALDEALPVSKAGEERAGRLITELNQQVNGILAGARGKVDLSQVADRVRTWAKGKYFKPGVTEGMHGDYEAALQVADAIDKHSSLTLPSGAKVTSVNPQTANEIKQAVRPPSRAYGQPGAAAETATRKVAGAEMRRAVEDLAPDIAALNAREGRLIDAQEAIARATGREENRNALFGVPSMIAGGAGAVEGYRKDPAAGIALALATRAALSPAVATRAAILASRFSKLPGMVPANAARMALAYARSESEQEP